MNVNSIRYYFKKLNPAHQSIYNQIYSAFKNFQHEVDIIVQSNLENFKTITEYILLDNPDIFFVDDKNFSLVESINKKTLCINYLYTQISVKNIYAQIESNIRTMINSMINIAEAEKEKIIYDYIAHNTKYNHSSSDNNKNHNILGVLIDKTAVCEGYAKAFKFLCDVIKIPCVVVFGSAKSLGGGELSHIPHQWNIVKINNACYHVDVTWDSIIYIKDKDCYDYFNISDDDMTKDHEWDMQLMPKCKTEMLPVQCVNSRKEFENFITSKLNQNNKSFQVKFNKQFKNESELSGIVQNFIDNAPFSVKRKFSGVKIRYNRSQSKATLNFD